MRWDAHCFMGHEQIEPLGGEHQAVTVLPVDRVPERGGVHLAIGRQIGTTGGDALTLPGEPPIVIADLAAASLTLPTQPGTQ